MTHTVLMVDDSMFICQQVQAVLAEAGFEVLVARDGREGIERADAATDLALVLCDLNMPRMGGFAFLDALRRSERYTRLPVVFLTAEAHPALIAQARSAGASGWIVKPLRAEALVTATRRLTERPPMAS